MKEIILMKKLHAEKNDFAKISKNFATYRSENDNNNFVELSIRIIM